MAPTYFRNNTMLKNIEPGHLWQQTPKGFVLVDDDQFVIVPTSSAQHFTVASTHH